jgi:hypothetical protein
MSETFRPTPPSGPLGHVPDDDTDRRPDHSGSRRRFDDRGGRRRLDWPEDSGLTACPGCGHEHLQSLGALDTGEYLWQCPHCDRRFNTGRATRTML